MSQQSPQLTSIDEELASEMSRFYADPYGYVMFAYPWGEPGVLEPFAGPDQWQKEFLLQIGEEVSKRNFDGHNPVSPLRFSRASGHGIGKSTLAAWITGWIMSTRPDALGTITANTFPQLSTRTWAQISHWNKLSIVSHWFEVTGDAMFHKSNKKGWRCTAQTCREENSEAFAGQHNVYSTSFYIFDEASAIPDKIFEVAEGGLTDGEPMIFLFGNPTRSSGQFYRVNFGRGREKWNNGSIDSRDCAIPNKEQLKEWEKEYGEDSDFFRVRVRGLPPRASDLQFIDADSVYLAMHRKLVTDENEPLICGIDLSRGGSGRCVMRFRRGYDARSIPPIRIPGEEIKNSNLLVTKITDVLDQKNPDFCFMDGTGVGGPIVDRVKQLGYKVEEIGFGERCPDHTHFANMRAWMWHKMREWLKKGCLEEDPLLETDLTGPQYGHDRNDRLVLESKEAMQRRGMASPDDGDGLCLTFAMPVGPKSRKRRRSKPRRAHPQGWMAS